jgi:hypothetical protein
MGETHFPTEIHCQLIKVYIDGTLRVQYVKNLSTQLKIGGKDVCNDDSARWPGVSYDGCEHSKVEEIILDKHQVEF